MHQSDVALQAKRLTALKLRERGATYRQIAEEMHTSAGYAHDLVRAGLKEMNEQAMESAEHVKMIELNRIDDLWYRLSQKLLGQTRTVEMKDGKKVDVPDPSERTVEAMLRVMERRAKLLGLDAPEQIGGPGGGPIPVAIEDVRTILIQRVMEMKKRLALAAGPESVTVVEPEVVADEPSAHGATDGLDSEGGTDLAGDRSDRGADPTPVSPEGSGDAGDDETGDAGRDP